MKWALLSDIHANIQALQACIEHASRQGIERWAVLGDLVGYGGDPLPVVQQVMRWHGEGACVLQGNHDAMAVTPPHAEGSLGAMTAAWTYQQLPPAERRWPAWPGLAATASTCLPGGIQETCPQGAPVSCACSRGRASPAGAPCGALLPIGVCQLS